MALDVYADIWNRVVLRAPDVGPLIAQDFVRNSFRRVVERRRWSWLVQFNQFISPANYNTGTVDVTQSSTTVQGNATGWTAALLYRQFRTGVGAPIYTITAVDVGAQQLTLDTAYGGDTATATGYSIYQCYFPTPTDFHAFISVWNPQYNREMKLNVKQSEINLYDAQRSSLGQAYLVSYRDTSTLYTGYSSGPGVSRYELWPYALGYTYPYLYESRPPDLGDSGATLPRFIRGDIILEMALAEAAAYPGTRDRPNSYHDLNGAKRHDARAEQLIAEAERQDDEVDMQDLMRRWATPDISNGLWFDAAFMQNHAF